MKKVITLLIISLVFGYLTYQIYRDWATIKDALAKAQYRYIVASLAIFSLRSLFNVKGWQLILRDLEERLSFYKCMSIYYYSQIGRYIPGKIWMIVGRIYLSEKEGISKMKTGYSLYIELTTCIIASFIVSYIAIQQYFYEFLKSPYWVIGGIIILCVILQPRVLEKSINLGFKVFRMEKKINITFSFYTILKFVAFYIIGWLISGLGLYFLVSSLFKIENPNIFVFSGFIAASWFIGLISIFSPGGLGVREGILVYFLSHLMPIPIAATISIFSRFLFTLIEFGFVGISYLFLNSSVTRKKMAVADYEDIN